MNDPLNWINRRTSAVGLLAGILLGAGWFTVPATMIAAMAPDSSPRQVLQQAKALEDEKRYEEAIAAYRQYLLSKPDHDDVRATMAKLLSWQGQRDEAIALYREILTRQPLDHDNRVGLARVLSWNKQFADARDEYERVLHDEPTHVEALVGMGDLLVWSGHREQAIPYYERAVAATGDEEIAARLRDVKAEVESIPAVPDPSATRRSTSEPTDGSQVLERGRRLETMRQPEDALAVYREGLRQFPEHDELRTAMARLLSWQGAHAEAVELYRDALARHPKDQDIRCLLYTSPSPRD